MASLELTVDGLRTEVSGKLDGDEASTMIEQSLQGLTLSAEAGDQSSTLILKAGGVTLSSAEITFRGMVTFEDLASAGGTTINGGNITTGKIGSEAGNTVYDPGRRYAAHRALGRKPGGDGRPGYQMVCGKWRQKLSDRGFVQQVRGYLYR